MRTAHRICAIFCLTAAFSTFAFGDDEGWIGTGYKPPQPAPTPTASQKTQELTIADTDEEFSYFDELYEATLLLLRMTSL